MDAGANGPRTYKTPCKSFTYKGPGCWRCFRVIKSAADILQKVILGPMRAQVPNRTQHCTRTSSPASGSPTCRSTSMALPIPTALLLMLGIPSIEYDDADNPKDNEQHEIHHIKAHHAVQNAVPLVLAPIPIQEWAAGDLRTAESSPRRRSAPTTNRPPRWVARRAPTISSMRSRPAWIRLALIAIADRQGNLGFMTSTLRTSSLDRACSDPKRIATLPSRLSIGTDLRRCPACC